MFCVLKIVKIKNCFWSYKMDCIWWIYPSTKEKIVSCLMNCIKIRKRLMFIGATTCYVLHLWKQQQTIFDMPIKIVGNAPMYAAIKEVRDSSNLWSFNYHPLLRGCLSLSNLLFLECLVIKCTKNNVGYCN